jgi:spore maturation protein SpmB
MIRRVKVYDAFAAGAMDGLRMILAVAPNICAAVICIGFLRRCGLLDYLAQLLAPAFTAVGMPEQTIGILLMRPFSGGACMGLLSNLLEQYGPDSYIARTPAQCDGLNRDRILHHGRLSERCKGQKNGLGGMDFAFDMLVGGICAACDCRVF